MSSWRLTKLANISHDSVRKFAAFASLPAMLSPAVAIRQAAAIPIRGSRMCLINSSSGRGWVIPKGHIEDGQSARETALQEAWEEAGLAGMLDANRVGSYRYEKKGNLYHVTVFLMRVTESAPVWPEDDRRERLWINALQATRYVQDPGLRRVLNLLSLRQSLSVDSAHSTRRERQPLIAGLS